MRCLAQLPLTYLFDFLEVEFWEGVNPIGQLHDEVKLDDEPKHKTKHKGKRCGFIVRKRISTFSRQLLPSLIMFSWLKTKPHRTYGIV